MLKLEMPSKDERIPLNARINPQAPHPAAHARLEVLVPRIPELDVLNRSGSAARVERKISTGHEVEWFDTTSDPGALRRMCAQLTRC